MKYNNINHNRLIHGVVSPESSLPYLNVVLGTEALFKRFPTRVMTINAVTEGFFSENYSIDIFDKMKLFPKLN